MRRLHAVLLAVLAGALAPLAFAGDATPKDAYLQYRAAYEKATTLADLLPHVDKQTKARFEALPKDQQKQMFDMMKQMDAATGVKVVKEAVTGGTAVLDIEGVQPDKKAIKGTADLVKEGAAWKVVRENWPM